MTGLLPDVSVTKVFRSIISPSQSVATPVGTRFGDWNMVITTGTGADSQDPSSTTA